MYRNKRPILSAMLASTGAPMHVRNTNPYPVTQHIREAVTQGRNPVMYGYGYGGPVYAAPVVAPAPVVYAAPVVAPTNWGARIAKILLGPLAW